VYLRFNPHILILLVRTERNYYLKDSGVDEVIHFHDECYGAYTHLAPAFGIDVPFKSVHLFEYLIRRLDDLKDYITPLNQKIRDLNEEMNRSKDLLSVKFEQEKRSYVEQINSLNEQIKQNERAKTADEKKYETLLSEKRNLEMRISELADQNSSYLKQISSLDAKLVDLNTSIPEKINAIKIPLDKKIIDLNNGGEK